MKYEPISLDAACTRDDKQRQSVNLLCAVRQGSRPWRMVRLEDMSPSGFRIAWFPGAMADKAVRIRIPGIQMLTAAIRWQEGNAVGCAFAVPLHSAVFAHILSQAGNPTPG